MRSCPASSHTPFGNGRFNRVCIAVRPTTACMPLQRDCLQCNANNSACVTCAHSRLLFNGTCVSACPSGFVSRGSGRFNRQCVPGPPLCQRLKDGCLVCDEAQRSCLSCTYNKVLFNSVCVARSQCPSTTHYVLGAGGFRLTCVARSLAADPQCSTHCVTCTSNASCSTCLPGFFLQESTCVSHCSERYARVRGFGLSSLCFPLPLTTCQPGQAGCATCAASASDVCSQCQAGYARFLGACLTHCPAQTLMLPTSSGAQCV